MHDYVGVRWRKYVYYQLLSQVFLLVGLLSTCQMTPVEDLSRAFSSPSPPSSIGTYSSIKTQPTQTQPHAIFSNLLPKLKVQTELPVRLPAYIPELEGSNRLYALLESVNASEYRIQLAFTEDCTGENACRLGSIFAEAITAQSPDLTGKTVALADGITGYFTDATCGANCSDAALTWQQDSVRYTIAVKAGKVETLARMANSAITIKLQQSH